MRFSPAACSILFALVLGACSSGSGGSGDATTPPQPVPPDPNSLTGTWSVSETITSATGACAGEVGNTDSYVLAVVQQGGSLQVTDQQGNVFQGSLVGQAVQWTGSFPDDGGTTTITAMNVTATNNNSLSGQVFWTWTDGATTCTGTTQITATKQTVDEPVGAFLVLDYRIGEGSAEDLERLQYVVTGVNEAREGEVAPGQRLTLALASGDVAVEWFGETGRGAVQEALFLAPGSTSELTVGVPVAAEPVAERAYR